MRDYQYIIFDVDDTLLDFSSAYLSAQQSIAEILGIICSKEYAELDDKCGWRAWNECCLDKTESREVQENYHQYYLQYLKKHSAYLLETLNIPYDETRLVNCYLSSISSSKSLMEENTLQIYIKLSEQYRLLLATNGLGRVQRVRVSAFLPYTHKLYISEEINAIKPTRDFYEYLLKDLSCAPGVCLMVGDSAVNDMLGAKAIGMDVCYYNKKRKAIPEDVKIDYEIYGMQELCTILL